MDEVVDLLYKLCAETREIVTRKEELTYDSFVRYLERRSDHFEKLQNHKWSTEEKAKCAPFVKEILQYDSILQQMMKHYKQEAAKQLEQIAGARKQQAGYENQAQYQLPVESLFFDQKK